MFSERIFRPQKNLLRVLGYQFQQPHDPIPWRLFSWFYSISLLVIVVPELGFVVANRANISLATNALCTILYCYSSLSKMVSLQLRRNRLYRMLDELKELWQNATDECRGILTNSLRIDRRMCSVYITSTLVTGAMYLIYPLAVGSYTTWIYGHAIWEMPMKSIFPFDTQKSPAYELVFLWFCHGTVAATVGSLASDTLCYGCVVYLSGHFRVIQSQVLAIRHENASTTKISKELAQLIRYHMRIIDLCDDLNTIFSPVVFTQFLFASVQLCVVAFQMTLPFESYFTSLLFFLFLATISFQCFIYCQAGSMLRTESLAVADAIYETKWYDLQPKTRLVMMFMLFRSQQPIGLETKFFEANLVTFSSIFTTAGSYITLLKTMPN